MTPEILNVDVTREILLAVSNHTTPVMLFGSVARGDASPQSDIDVLELSPRRKRPYRVGRVNVSVYDQPTLVRMAERGSLFVLHLRLEGKIVRDPESGLQHCLDRYNQPKTYAPFRTALREITNLLDADQEQYESRWQPYNELALYVLRSELYARLAETGQPAFSVKDVVDRFGRADVARVLALKDSALQDCTRFEEAKSLIEELLKTTIKNPFGSIEALVTNCGHDNSLLVAFGLRILGRERFELSYDLVTAPPFA